jgi:hypothetical protein
MTQISKTLSLGLIGLTLAGCASAPKVEWIADKKTDEFTDKTTCRATTGSLYTHSAVYTKNGAFYPMVEQVDGVLRVGLQSGGKYKIPVGNVQIRIDSNNVWDISTNETPVDLVPTANPMATLTTSNLNDEQKKIVEQSIATAMNSTTQALSPYTVATGDKAKSILKEMLDGKELKYRTVGLNQSASTIGTFKLDKSLKTALDTCNIRY